MKSRTLLLCCWLLCLQALPLPALAASPVENCIILVRPDSGLLSRQSDRLHQLIDLLPEDCRLGIGFPGVLELLAPAPLTLSRRADLHAVLQAASALGSGTERDWSQLVSAALLQLPVSRTAESNRLILVQSGEETKADWTAHIAAMAERQVQAVLLTEQPAAAVHPLVKQTGGQQRVLDSNALSTLARQLGLASGELLQSTVLSGLAACSFHLDDAVQGVVLMIERALPEDIRLLSPGSVQLTSETGITHCLTTPTYTCLHVNRQEGHEQSWSGDWQLTIPEQATVSLWLDDPVQLLGTVTAASGSRLITAAIWRGGERMTGPALGTGRVLLRDQSHRELLRLNDIGLNGDQTAGDGVFSGNLPQWLHPLAGTAVLEVQGYVYRSAELTLPRADALTPSSRVGRLPLIALAAAFSGLAGLISVSRRPVPNCWQLSHRSPNGYQHRARCGRRPLYAGSDPACYLRLAASTGRRHLRLAAVDGCKLSLEILSAEPATLVNGARVFLRQELEHGDLIEVAGDRLLVEHLSKLRSGRRQLAQSGRDFAPSGQSNR